MEWCVAEPMKSRLNFLMKKNIDVIFVAIFFCCHRSVEGSRPTYHHDRYSDGSAVVHLRFSESVLPSSASPTT